MHTASSLVIPAGVPAPRRPQRPPRGTLRLGAEQLGVIRRRDLLSRHRTESEIRTAVRRGELRKIAHGWLATPAADAEVVDALAALHRITCTDAARMHGLWVPHDTSPQRGRLHVYRYDTARSAPSGMLTHPSATRTWPEPDAVASLPLALEHAMRCRDGETAAILLESALERRLLSPATVQELVDRAPDAIRSRIGPLSTASDSGSETRVVRWLRRRGFRVEQQVFVEGVGFVDAYVNGLFLEIDGREHHGHPDAFDRDRRRDLRSLRNGLQVLRLSYAQVWNTWDRTKQDVLDALSEVGPLGRRKVAKLALR